MCWRRGGLPNLEKVKLQWEFDMSMNSRTGEKNLNTTQKPEHNLEGTRKEEDNDISKEVSL